MEEHLTKYEVRSYLLTDMLLVRKIVRELAKKSNIENISFMHSEVYLPLENTRTLKEYIIEVTLSNIEFSPIVPRKHAYEEQMFISKKMVEYFDNILKTSFDMNYRLDIRCKKL